MGEVAAIRLDYLLKMCNAVRDSERLREIIGEPVEENIGLIVKDRRFYLHQVTPVGGTEREFTPGEKKEAQQIVREILRKNMPGTENLPEIR